MMTVNSGSLYDQQGKNGLTMCFQIQSTT